jgi:N-acetyl-anhydromuramyl-L-alanine amidase AmpD
MAEIQPFVNLSQNNFNLIKPFFKKIRDGRSRDLSTVNTVVLHWTAGANLSSDIATLRNDNNGYHFLIDKSGNVYQGCPLNKMVGHAGYSYGPKGSNVNDYSIGISFSMRGILDDGSQEEFTDAMYESCINLIKDLKIAVPTLEFITGHHWISPRRKIDPYTFNFNRLKGGVDPSFKIWKTEDPPFPSGLSSSFRDKDGFRYTKAELNKSIPQEFIRSDLETE